MTKNEHTIHQQNINVLMKEIYKFENDLSPPLIDDMFLIRKINYNLRHFQKLQILKTLSKNWSRDNILPCTSIMELSSNKIKDAPSLSVFKQKTKSWYYDNCPCRVCKTYIANVGFV